MPGRCWCARSALDDLLAEGRRWPLRETGGALLGWCEGDHWAIARVLGPGPAAKHRLSSFEPDTVWQNAQGQRIYHESARTIRYLGDWHTHPRGVPRPSGQDRRTARLIAEDPGFQTPQPLYAIAGHRHPLAVRSPWMISLFVVLDGELTQLPMTVYED